MVVAWIKKLGALANLYSTGRHQELWTGTEYSLLNELAR